MKNPFKSYAAQLILAVFSGAGTAVVIWFINRPNPTIVTCAVTTTSLGADATVKGLIPNLRLQIGTEEIPVVHTHSIELSVPQGQFLDQADVVVTFPSTVRVFGKILTEAPSLAYRIECNQLKGNPNDDQHILGLSCALSPLKPGSGKFRIVLSTDSREAPIAAMAVRNAELMRADAYLLQRSKIFGMSGDIFGAALALLSGVAFAMVGRSLIDKWVLRQIGPMPELPDKRPYDVTQQAMERFTEQSEKFMKALDGLERTIAEKIGNVPPKPKDDDQPE